MNSVRHRLGTPTQDMVLHASCWQSSQNVACMWSDRGSAGSEQTDKKLAGASEDMELLTHCSLNLPLIAALKRKSRYCILKKKKSFWNNIYILEDGGWILKVQYQPHFFIMKLVELNHILTYWSCSLYMFCYCESTKCKNEIQSQRAPSKRVVNIIVSSIIMLMQHFPSLHGPD